MAHKIHSNGPRLSTPKDARAIRTRKVLHHALLKLLEIKPLGQITVRDIATKAGVGYATFFRHYAAKESLLNEVAAEEIQRLLGVTMPILHTTGDSWATTVALCSYVHEGRALWSALLSDGAVGALREQFLMVSRRIAKELSRPDHWVPNDIAVILVVTGTIELLAWWLRQTEPLAIAKVAEILDRIVVAPSIRSDGGDLGHGTRSPLRIGSARHRIRIIGRPKT